MPTPTEEPQQRPRPGLANEPTRDLFNRVRLAREGAAVERTHAHPHLMRYSVGHHSLDMVTLITLAWQAEHGRLPRAELLVAAAFHDVPERITGDLPSPVKTKLGAELDAMDDQVLTWLGVGSTRLQLTDAERAYLVGADRLELVLWCLEEAQRGNEAFLDWVEGYHQLWFRRPLPPGLMVVWAEANRLGMSRLNDQSLMEIVK